MNSIFILINHTTKATYEVNRWLSICSIMTSYSHLCPNSNDFRFLLPNGKTWALLSNFPILLGQSQRGKSLLAKGTAQDSQLAFSAEKSTGRTLKETWPPPLLTGLRLLGALGRSTEKCYSFTLFTNYVRASAPTYPPNTHTNANHYIHREGAKRSHTKDFWWWWWLLEHECLDVSCFFLLTYSLALLFHCHFVLSWSFYYVLVNILYFIMWYFHFKMSF